MSRCVRTAEFDVVLIEEESENLIHDRCLNMYGGSYSQLGIREARKSEYFDVTGQHIHVEYD